MSEHCPVDDCGFGEDVEKTRAQVAQHIRMSGDDAHDVDPDSILGEETVEIEESDESNASEPGSADVNPGEDAEESDSETAELEETDESDSVPTDDELKTQRDRMNETSTNASTTNEQESSTNDDSSTSTKNTPENPADAPAISIPSFDFSTQQWVLVGALAATVALGYLITKKKRSKASTLASEDAAIASSKSESDAIDYPTDNGNDESETASDGFDASDWDGAGA